jgi:hypothetical protein
MAQRRNRHSRFAATEQDVQTRNTVVQIWIWKARTRLRTVAEEMSEEKFECHTDDTSRNRLVF